MTKPAFDEPAGNLHDSSRIIALGFLAALLMSTGSPLSAAERPNILLIVMDDAAYSDIGVYGGEIDTPKIDQLAKNGVQFTQLCVTPDCSSTRAALLTGMDHHRTGLGTPGPTADNQRGKPGYEGYLNNRVATLQA